VTLFEYLSVAVSIVLSLSAAQILVNLRAVFDPARRYWVHALWVVMALFVHLLVWWGFWAYRVVESWNLATFSLVLLNPGILFVASTTLVHNAAKLDRSWEQHFFDIRRSFFVIFGMIPAGSVLRDWILFDTPVMTWFHLPELLMTAICIVGWASANRRIQSILVLASMVVLATFTSSIWLQPGAGREIVQ
jgi:hypothetical protein